MKYLVSLDLCGLMLGWPPWVSQADNFRQIFFSVKNTLIFEVVRKYKVVFSRSSILLDRVDTEKRRQFFYICRQLE